MPGTTTEIQLVLSDMDGTLLPAGTHTVSRRNHDGFAEAMERFVLGR